MPIYNMEKYVETAIESWLEQTIDDKELICVDDCSTDRSLDILKRYEKKYANISVHTMESNQGVGCVRRKAMSLVQGEYVGFLDADDKYLNPNALQMLYDAAVESDSDVSGGLLSNYTEHEVKEYPRFRCLFDSGVPWIDLKYEDFQDDYFFQGFIYRTSFLKENKIEFPPFLRNEDPPFLVRALYFSNNIRIVNVEFYGHREGHKKVDYTTESIMDLFEGFLMNMKFADEFRLMRLFNKTVKRLNVDYLYVLYQGLLSGNRHFLGKLVEADQMVMKYGLQIGILEYVFYLTKESDKFNVFQAMLKLREPLSKCKKLILYGAGNIGKIIFSAIMADDLCEIVMWIDHYKSGNRLNGRMLYDITDIKKLGRDYDRILIGIDHVSISQQVKEELKSQGISEDIIIEWVNL